MNFLSLYQLKNHRGCHMKEQPIFSLTLSKITACAALMAAVVLSSTPASALTMFANSATSGPDLLHELDISGSSGTLVQNYTVSTGNGRSVVVVGDVIYSTESGPSGDIFGGSNLIYMTDRNTGLPLGTITVSGLPSGAAMSTLAWDGAYFWTSEYLGGNAAYQIDTSGNIVKTITLSQASVNMDGMEYFNGKLIANRGDTVGPYDVYDLDGNLLQADFIDPSLQGCSDTTGIAFDGTNFYTSCIYGSYLQEWDGTTGAFIQNVTLSGGSFLIEDLSVDYNTRPDTGQVPEPSSLLLLGAGLAWLGLWGRKYVLAKN
jgi:PEP-CTERM motif